MWPFGRKRDAPTATGPAPLPAPVIRRDWATLPPIQRSIGEHPLTAPPDRFSDDLVTHHDPSVSSERMGHQVSAEAPPGILLTVARSVDTRADGPAMIPRPRVQRRAQDAVAELGEWNGDEAAPEAVRPTPLPTSIQRTAVIERPVVEPVTDFPRLTTLPHDVEPQPVAAVPRRAPIQPQIEVPHLQRSEVMEVAPAPRLTLGQARRLGLGAPIKKVSERSPVQRAETEPPPMPLAPAPAAAIPSPSEPVAPLKAADQPTADSNKTRGAEGPREHLLTVSRSLEPTRSEAPGAEQDRLELPLAPGRAAGSSTSPEPHLQGEHDASEPTLAHPPTTVVASGETPHITAVQRAAGGIASSHPETALLSPAGAAQQGTLNRPGSMPLTLSRLSASLPIDAAVSPRSTATPVLAPLVSERPLKPGASLQRSIEPAPAATLPPSRLEPEPDARRAVDGFGDGLPQELTRFAPTADASGAPVVLQRSAAGNPTAGAVPPATSSWPTLVLAKPGVPVGPSGVAQQTSSSWWGPFERAQELPLAPVAAPLQRVASAESAAPATDQSADGSLQRSWINPEVPISRLEEGSATVHASAPSAATTSAATAEAGSQSPHGDLEMLASKLYERIRSRLKTELLVDRERAGRLTDLR